MWFIRCFSGSNVIYRYFLSSKMSHFIVSLSFDCFNVLTLKGTLFYYVFLCKELWMQIIHLNTSLCKNVIVSQHLKPLNYVSRMFYLFVLLLLAAFYSTQKGKNTYLFQFTKTTHKNAKQARSWKCFIFSRISVYICHTFANKKVAYIDITNKESLT